ncbi:hypothetical protein [Lysinibacillus sp. NPDC047702]|uniref:hypothetical protein n=1 Tax=unclassified Lysinibacillus TaxID=2636778 RepID=UPI003D06FA7D
MHTIADSKKLFQQLAKQALAPPPNLTVFEWADAHRKLSRESSAEAGQWRVVLHIKFG